MLVASGKGKHTCSLRARISASFRYDTVVAWVVDVLLTRVQGVVLISYMFQTWHAEVWSCGLSMTRTVIGCPILLLYHYMLVAVPSAYPAGTEGKKELSPRFTKVTPEP